ncbi:MAG: toll/interleukin-1 receptor domain-containing protein [Mesorhizobium sp.]|nr:MAG: toll/interleukin-1 receptor domain-containing protein [Mesorhizobium sp.]
MTSTRPFLVVYVAWHPSFAGGPAIARGLYNHYRRELYENVAGGTGLSVLYRSEPDPGSGAPIGIDIDEGETAAIIMIVDESFAVDEAYMAWARDLMDRTEAAGLRARVFPVAIDGALIRVGVAQQAVRWDKWQDMEEGDRMRRLTSDLTYQFSRMLRSYLERLRRPDEEDAALEQYLRKVQVFLSHSKRDQDGERIAKLIRETLFKGDGLATFFDVHDIPTGVRFDRAIVQQVRVSAVVAIHTDSYSSREWCRREIIEAKRWNVPLVIANCIADADERGFPYMGNVPVVRMDPQTTDRIDQIVARLLDEVLKDFLWRCRIEIAKAGEPEDVVFLPRPPELISLAGLEGRAGADVTLVYPDPPLGSEEQRLFEVIAPNVRLRSLTEWLAEEER